MATLDTLTTRFEADIIKFEDAMRRMQRSTQTATDRVTRTHQDAARGSRRAWEQAGIDRAIQNSIGRPLQGITTLSEVNKLMRSYD